jgi:superkiller protein 3
MSMNSGSRTDDGNGATPVTTDEDALLDAAMYQADDRLVAALREDELRRRRKRRRLIGGLAMTLTVVGVMIGVTIVGANPTPAEKQEAAALTQSGWQLFGAQKWLEAEVSFDKAVKLDPKFANAWNGLGWAKFNGGDAEAAEKAFNRCLSLDRLNGGARNGMGNIYFMQREYKKAEKQWLQVKETAPAAWYGLAKMYLLTEQFDKALPWAERIVKQNPDDADAPKLLAAAESKSLDDDLRKLIEPAERNPGQVDPRKGWALFNQGRLAEAIPIFQAAVEADPKDPHSHNGLGFCLLNTGKTAEAKPHFEKALELEPKHGGAMNGLARCLKVEGKTADAIAVWERMEKLTPAPNAGTAGLAWTHLEQGNYAKAVEYFEPMAKSMPNDASVRQGLNQAKAGLAKQN